jgi:predicted nucleic acid-binding protein
MRFWDASAVVPLLVNEPGTAQCRRWLAEDAEMVLWAMTRVEVAAAIERRARDGSLDGTERATLLADVARLAEGANEVIDLSSVRARALAVLARHPLRAADALQLAAVTTVADPDPSA